MLLALVLLCAAVAFAGASDYHFHAQTELVLVNVTVRDKNGNFVRDLKPRRLHDSRRQQAAEGHFLRSGKYRRGAAAGCAQAKPLPDAGGRQTQLRRPQQLRPSHEPLKTGG